MSHLWARAFVKPLPRVEINTSHPFILVGHDKHEYLVAVCAGPVRHLWSRCLLQLSKLALAKGELGRSRIGSML